MERRNFNQRYEELQQRRDELAGGVGPQPTAVHVQTVRVLRELLTMGRTFSTGRVPAPLRAMMRMLDKMEPELTRELAHVPPQAIREFLGDLVRRILSIIETPVEGEAPTHGGDASSNGSPAPAGADQSASA